MGRIKQTDHGLEALLSLHGHEFVLDSGDWISFRIWFVECSETVPHGIRYSLTLHDRHNQRLVGFDNAHASRTRKRRFEPKSTARDHWHQGNDTHEYKYESAEKLLADFFTQVDQQLQRAK